MTRKPTDRPVDPGALPRLARAVIAADRFPFLATVDQDRPRLRPVSPVRTDGFTVYVASLQSYQKTGELEANPAVALAYLSADHDQVRSPGGPRSSLTGRCSRRSGPRTRCCVIISARSRTRS